MLLSFRSTGLEWRLVRRLVQFICWVTGSPVAEGATTAMILPCFTAYMYSTRSLRTRCGAGARESSLRRSGEALRAQVKGW